MDSGYSFDVKTVEDLIEALNKSGKKYDIEKIQSAYEYASEMHKGQFRKSGEPYISHPVAVAIIVVELGLDADSVCAALLHDTVEDCSDKTNLFEIAKRFGSEVAMLVDGLTKLVQLNVSDKEEAEIENLRKMFLAMSKDIRVIFIKLCDRLHNMRTLMAKPEEKRRMTALETMHVYAPLAHRLGIQKVKQELEQLSLSYLDPIGFREVQEDIDRKYGMNADFIENTKKTVSDKLKEYDLKFSLYGRVKSVYSIYRKMYNQSKSFDEIYDFYAIRIIVDTELECYTVLGIIHEMFKSVPGRFKDYISTPKPNLYRSLHTTVMGKGGVPFEVQIRTWEMHHVAEYGICAHWKYKSGSTSQQDVDEKLQWVAKLLESEGISGDTDDFTRTLKIDMFHDEVFVFTPKGDVIVLPQGATLIDFAYAIHTEVGNKMVGAKINGCIATIDSSPKNGEIVEIITSASSKGPSRDWLKIVKTGEARNKIRQWFKREKRVDNILIGKAEVEREIKRWSRNITDSQMEEVVSNVAKRLGVNCADDLYNTIGYGGMSVTKVTAKLKDEIERVVQTAEPEPEIEIKPTVSKSVSHGHKSGIRIDGVDGCQVKFAKCCNPLPGDAIIGFITKGYGVSIHKIDCENVRHGIDLPENQGRYISASWESYVNANKSADYEAMITVFANDEIGILAKISSTLADLRVQIASVQTVKSKNGATAINLVVAARDTAHVDYIVSHLRQLSCVNSVKRGL